MTAATIWRKILIDKNLLPRKVYLSSMNYIAERMHTAFEDLKRQASLGNAEACYYLYHIYAGCIATGAMFNAYYQIVVGEEYSSRLDEIGREYLQKAVRGGHKKAYLHEANLLYRELNTNEAIGLLGKLYQQINAAAEWGEEEEELYQRIEAFFKSRKMTEPAWLSSSTSAPNLIEKVQKSLRHSASLPKLDAAFFAPVRAVEPDEQTRLLANDKESTCCRCCM